MARNHARIHVSTYDVDSRFTDLDLAHQGLYWLLLARRDVNLCGVLPYKPKVWVTRTNATLQEVEDIVAELERLRYLVVDRATDEVWIRTFIFHDQVLAMPQVAMSMAGHFDSVDSETIRSCIVRSLPPAIREGFPDNLRRDRKAVSELLATCDAASHKPPIFEVLNIPSDMGSGMGNGMGSGNPSGMGPGKGKGTGKGIVTSSHVSKPPTPTASEAS